MGRYFMYRMHPLTLGEISNAHKGMGELNDPCRPGKDAVDTLLTYGGFPEPFLKTSSRFYNRWVKLRAEQLFREDMRDLSDVHEIGQIETLAECLNAQTGDLCNYSSLARIVNCSVDSIRRWIVLLEEIHYCFTIRPWFKNVQKSLRKQPKVYLWDWSLVADPAKRRENLVASHLLKAVHWWNDIDLGEYGLHFIRDKAKRDVDFLISRNNKPWFLVESKTSSKRSLSKHLMHFHAVLQPEHSFQMVFDLPFVERNCFDVSMPVVVPVETFLSQLW